jgi:hypothetical protein
VWHDFGYVFHQRHISTSHNPSYAVYQLVRTTLPFIKTQGYDSFFYVEGDLLIDDTDIKKILELETMARSENKSATFFDGLHEHNWWDCQLFYSDVDFFISNTPTLFSFDDFESYCNKVGAGVHLESFMYRMLYNSHTNKVKKITNTVTKYMNNSQTNLTGINNEFDNYYFEVSHLINTNEYVQYAFSAVKLLDTDKIFLTYRKMSNTYTPTTEIYVNDGLVLDTRGTRQYFVFAEITTPDEFFNVKIVENGKMFKEFRLSRESILKDSDYIKIST